MWDLLHPAGNAANDMVVANKDVMTFPELCSSPQCQGKPWFQS